MDNEGIEKALQEILEELKAIMAEIKAEAPKPTIKPQEGPLTKRALLELVSHEAIVREAYKDSKGIWTWGIGVTDKSGHKVLRYKDNPQSIKKVIEIFKWLVETKYLPDVLEAFKGVPLSEAQLAAAVSFHYNTGGILKAQWVKQFIEGKVEESKKSFLLWNKPKEIIGRRTKERDLFFSGKWSNDGKATVYEIRKPSYLPNWASAKRIDISKELD